MCIVKIVYESSEPCLGIYVPFLQEQNGQPLYDNMQVNDMVTAGFKNMKLGLNNSKHQCNVNLLIEFPKIYQLVLTNQYTLAYHCFTGSTFPSGKQESHICPCRVEISRNTSYEVWVVGLTTVSHRFMGSWTEQRLPQAHVVVVGSGEEGYAGGSTSLGMNFESLQPPITSSLLFLSSSVPVKYVLSQTLGDMPPLPLQICCPEL